MTPRSGAGGQDHAGQRAEAWPGRFLRVVAERL